MQTQIPQAVWLKAETDRVQAILLSPVNDRKTWTQNKLQRMLADVPQLDYSNAEIALIWIELHTRGILEDV